MDVAVVMASGTALVGLDTWVIELAVQRLRAMVILLGDADHGVERSAPAGWTGAGHDGALAVIGELRSRLHALAGALEAVGSALLALAAVLRAVQAEVEAARRVLGAAGPLDVTGSVAGQVESAVLGFGDADRRAAAIVCDALLVNLVGRQGGAAQLTRTPLKQAQTLAAETAVTPAIPAAAPAIAIWWAGLPAATQSALAAARPGSLGGLDGIPARGTRRHQPGSARVRHRAGSARLPAAWPA